MPRQALVVGGGPAGSVAALVLARGGWGVTLVEQHRFPRDKVCGECLSALGAEVLQRLGLFGRLLGCSPVKLVRTALHAPRGETVLAPLPRPMWGVSRTALDGLLLDAARAAGVTVRQPARAESVEPGSRPAARVRDLLTNVVERVEVDHVIVADGKAAASGNGPPRPTGDLGIKAHFRSVAGPRDSIELFGLSGCYGGLAPIEGGLWNTAFSVPAARVRQNGGDLEATFRGMMEENATLRDRLAGAERLGKWLASPLPRFPVRRNWRHGITPVGNAAAAIEPIGGEGMGLAMRSAELAASSLSACEGAWTRGEQRLLARNYRRLWRTRGPACRAAALAASQPAVANRVAHALARAPCALQAGISLMGK